MHLTFNTVSTRLFGFTIYIETYYRNLRITNNNYSERRLWNLQYYMLTIFNSRIIIGKACMIYGAPYVIGSDHCWFNRHIKSFKMQFLS